MTRNFFFIAVLALMISCNEQATTNKTSPQKAAPTVQIKGTTALEVEKEAFDKYDLSPKESIPYFKKAANLFLAEEKYPKAALALSNLAAIYEQTYPQTDSALFFANQSIDLYKQLKDELQYAEMLLFIGNFKEKTAGGNGKPEILAAIEKFEKLKMYEKAAIEKFNLSIRYFSGGDLQRSKDFWQQSTDYWHATNDKTKIFGNNLFGIELFENMDDMTKVKQLIQESDKILPTIQVNSFKKNRYENLKGRLKMQNRIK